MTSEQVLQAFRDTKALLSGHFELRSGLHSDQFFQCALVLQYPRVAESLCAELTRKLSAFKNADVISPAMGGLFVGHEMGRALGVRHIFAEKQDNKLVMRRGFQIQPGQHFIVAEDVVTRGGRHCRRGGGAGGSQRRQGEIRRAGPQPHPNGACDLAARGMPALQSGEASGTSGELRKCSVFRFRGGGVPA